MIFDYERIYTWSLGLRAIGAVVALIVGLVMANGQTVQTTTGSLCYIDGVYFLPRSTGVCFTEDRDKQRITTNTGVTSSAKPAPQCKKDWHLVMWSGQPMCAPELRHPE